MARISKAHVDRLAPVVVRSFFPAAESVGLTLTDIATLLDVTRPTVVALKRGTSRSWRSLVNMSWAMDKISDINDERAAFLKRTPRAREAWIKTLTAE